MRAAFAFISSRDCQKLIVLLSIHSSFFLRNKEIFFKRNQLSCLPKDRSLEAVDWYVALTSPGLSSYDLIGAFYQQSSGRGGMGNILRSPSRDVDRTVASVDDYSDTRGRDPIPVRYLDNDVRYLSLVFPSHTPYLLLRE